MNDLRVPIGCFFTLVGIVLLVVGLKGPAVSPALATANVDLYCGATMLVFGGIMLWLSRRAN